MDFLFCIRLVIRRSSLSNFSVSRIQVSFHSHSRYFLLWLQGFPKSYSYAFPPLYFCSYYNMAKGNFFVYKSNYSTVRDFYFSLAGIGNIHIMCDDNHSFAVIIQIFEKFHNFGRSLCIQCPCRLICKYE